MPILNKNLLKDLVKNLPKDRINKYLQSINFGEERTRKITTIVLTLASLSFFGLFAINPTVSTIATLRKEISDSKFIDKKLQQKINNLSTLQDKYALLEQDLPLIISAVPIKPEIPLLVAQIQTVVKNSGASLESLQTFEVDLDKPGVQKKFFSFSFALSAQGTYNDLIEFIDTLTNMPRVVSLDSVSITRKTGQTSLLQLTLKGKAFFSQ